MTPAKGAGSGGTACANSSNPTAVALPVARCTCKINAVVAIASPNGLDGLSRQQPGKAMRPS
jgi:hypothetical protein